MDLLFRPHPPDPQDDLLLEQPPALCPLPNTPVCMAPWAALAILAPKAVAARAPAKPVSAAAAAGAWPGKCCWGEGFAIPVAGVTRAPSETSFLALPRTVPSRPAPAPKTDPLELVPIPLMGLVGTPGKFPALLPGSCVLVCAAELQEAAVAANAPCIVWTLCCGLCPSPGL